MTLEMLISITTTSNTVAGAQAAMDKLREFIIKPSVIWVVTQHRTVGGPFSCRPLRGIFSYYQVITTLQPPPKESHIRMDTPTGHLEHGV